MKPYFLFITLLLISSTVIAKPYSLFSVQAIQGQDSLNHSSSAFFNIGMGLANDFGLYSEVTLGVNAEEVFSELLNSDQATVDFNQQSGKVDFILGYRLDLNRYSYMRFGAGFDCAVFREDCLALKDDYNNCENKYEFGPAYTVSYFIGKDKARFGLEFHRYDLSSTRKYNGLSLTLRGAY
ncbi:hypothetical protein [Algibacillus agarilyticus]|uniref:hypothetical protein n=1 Tax=Algibacillus agarilyticus TaxID=2234133 RepID=UPI000DCFB7CF|nr:hypothetical protein [Algibacillus agarilyticus]